VVKGPKRDLEAEVEAEAGTIEETDREVSPLRVLTLDFQRLSPEERKEEADP
jgi:hypothetical protein